MVYFKKLEYKVGNFHSCYVWSGKGVDQRAYKRTKALVVSGSSVHDKPSHHLLMSSSPHSFSFVLFHELRENL